MSLSKYTRYLQGIYMKHNIVSVCHYCATCVYQSTTLKVSEECQKIDGITVHVVKKEYGCTCSKDLSVHCIYTLYWLKDWSSHQHSSLPWVRPWPWTCWCPRGDFACCSLSSCFAPSRPSPSSSSSSLSARDEASAQSQTSSSVLVSFHTCSTHRYIHSTLHMCTYT